MSQNVVDFSSFQKKHFESQVYNRWVEHFTKQPHEELLETLVSEHENDFPMRRSDKLIDQLQHKALVDVLEKRAQTQFMKSFIQEIRQNLHN